MTAASPEKAIGFLSVHGSIDGGLWGGLLLLNPLGRPLEFHCTAPVKANRAQQILYGPTLAPFLYGEQIGATLSAQAKKSLAILFVAQPESLAMRPLVDVPVVLALPRHETAREELDNHRFETLEVSGHQLGIHFAEPDDVQRIEQVCRDLQDFDLLEPFERIEDALSEAQRAA